MEKKEKIALILILILAIIFILPKFHITGDSVNQKHSYTKAICDEKGSVSRVKIWPIIKALS